MEIPRFLKKKITLATLIVGIPLIAAIGHDALLYYNMRSEQESLKRAEYSWFNGADWEYFAALRDRSTQAEVECRESTFLFKYTRSIFFKDLS